MEGKRLRDLGVDAGDDIVCVFAATKNFTEGKTYRVQRHATGYTYVVANGGHGIHTPASRFVRASDYKQEKFEPRPAEAEFMARDVPSDRQKGKIASDGGSTDYYKVPEHATELRHLISHKGMSKSRGDIFKACYRLGEKEGVDMLYDLNKMKFFIDDLIEMYHRGEHI